MTTEQEIQLTQIAFQAIVKIVEAIRDAKAGKVDPDAVIANVTTLRDQLSANNAAADGALDAKFKP